MGPVLRGEIWWADLDEPRRGSEQGYRGPVLVVQSDSFNLSRIATVVTVVLTSNLRLAEAPGNLLLPARATGLLQDSVLNVSQLVTIDRQYLTERAGVLPARWQARVDQSVRTILEL